MSDFKSKMHQIQFPYFAPPDPLAGFKGPTAKGREGRKRREGVGEIGGGWERREGKGGEGGREGGEREEDVEGPGKWSAPGPVLALSGPAVHVFVP